MTAGLPRTRSWRERSHSDLVGKLFLLVAALPIGPGKIL
jgi:hypothetical protein